MTSHNKEPYYCIREGEKYDIFFLDILLMIGYIIFIPKHESIYHRIAIYVCFSVAGTVHLIKEFPKRKNIVLLINKKGIYIKQKEKIIHSKRKGTLIIGKNYLELGWDQVDYFELRAVDLGQPRLWNEEERVLCIHIIPKHGKDVWFPIYDYIWSIKYSSRKIRRTVYRCTGRTDLFIDRTSDDIKTYYRSKFRRLRRKRKHDP